MRKAGFGLISALSVSVLGLAAPATAQAAPAGTVLHVSNVGSCDDNGPGTQAMPYCTLQAAADAAQPGDTVQVESATVQPATPVVITHSGTATAPITITSSDPGFQPPKIYGLSVSGAAHVVVSNLAVYSGVTVDNATDVTLDRLTVNAPRGSVGLQVSGDSSQVTVSRDEITMENESGVVVDPGATGVVVTTNLIQGDTGSAANPTVSVTGAPGTDVVSNTVTGVCTGALISLDGGSGSSVVENNVLTLNSSAATGCAGSAQTGVQVSADSQTGTTVDYNDVYAPSNMPLYSWGGTTYPTVAAFTTATGQGTHDIDAAPDYATDNVPCSLAEMPAQGSPLIDSADADAPGELSTDFTGAPRTDDPATPNTGTGVGYYDRGALERQVCLDLSRSSVQLNGPRAVVAELSVGANWGPISTTVTWGDGTSSQAPSGPGTQDLGHSYAQPGSYLVTATATGPDGEQKTYAQNVTVDGSDYVAEAPTRVLDTRNGTGTGGTAKQVPAHSAIRLQLAQTAGSPAGAVTAAVLNVTAVDSTAAGYLSAYPDGSSSVSSFLNYASGAVTANLVTVPVAANGYVDLYNGSSRPVDLVADLQGYYVQSSAGGFDPAKPARLLDTRVPSPTRAAGVVPAHGQVTFQAAGANGVPAAGVTAVVANVTETGATAAGFVTAFPGGQSVPTASDLNFTSGATVANLVTVPVGSNGTVTLYNGSSRPVQLIADLQGYYTAGSGLVYTPFQTRLLDTRPGQPGEGSGTTVTGAPLGSGQDLPLEPGNSLGWYDFFGTYHMPQAVLMNSTVTNTKAAGYLSLTPTQVAKPSTSNLNFAAGQTIAGLTAADLDSGGSLWFYNASHGTTDLIADVEGYFS